MFVINNFSSRKFIETISFLSYSFSANNVERNVRLVNMAVHSIALFYKGLKYDLTRQAQFNYAQSRINIQLHPEDFMPVKKCVFHIEIQYSRKGSAVIETYHENIKFIPRTIQSIGNRSRGKSPKACNSIKYRDVGKNEAEVRIMELLKKIHENNAGIWRGKDYDTSIELAVIVKGENLYLTKKFYDKSVAKEESKRFVDSLVESGFIKTFSNVDRVKRVTRVSVPTKENNKNTVSAYAFTDKLIHMLEENGITF